MTVPECTPPEPASPNVEEKTPVITREVLQSYLLCRVKGISSSWASEARRPTEVDP